MRSLRFGSRIASLACLLLVLPWSDHAAAAPLVDQVNPSMGQVGHVVVLRGRGLGGTNLEVRFGRAQALEAHNPGGSGEVIELRVPNKVDPRDPDTVEVTVTVDGVGAIGSAGSLQFTYEAPQPPAS